MKTVPEFEKAIEPTLQKARSVEAGMKRTKTALDAATHRQAALRAGGDHEDPKVLHELREVNSQLELLPIRLQSLEGEYQALRVELTPHCRTFARGLYESIGNDLTSGRAEVISTVKSLLSPQYAGDMSRLAGEISMCSRFEHAFNVA